MWSSSKEFSTESLSSGSLEVAVGVTTSLVEGEVSSRLPWLLVLEVIGEVVVLCAMYNQSTGRIHWEYSAS